MGDWRSNAEHNLNQVNIGQEDLATALSAAIRDKMSISGETTHPGGMTNSRNWFRISVDNSAASLLPGLWVGSMFSPCSDLL
jgi:hypothetical protein